MKSFEEWKKEQKEKKAEISADDLMSAAATVCATDERIKMLISNDFTLMLTFPLFISAISEVIFDKGENDEQR